jgi:hypothetical protein
MFLIYKFISKALGPGHRGPVRAFHPRPEISPARDQLGPRSPSSRDQPGPRSAWPEISPARDQLGPRSARPEISQARTRKARTIPRAFWIFSCFLKEFLTSSFHRNIKNQSFLVNFIQNLMHYFWI